MCSSHRNNDNIVKLFEKQRRRQPGVFEVRPGTPDPGHQTHWHRKGKLQSLNNKQWKKISTGKPTPSQMSRRQSGRFPDVGSELTCSSSASRRNRAREIKASQCQRKQRVQQGIQETMKYGSWKTQQKLSSATHVTSDVKLRRTEPMRGLCSFLPVWGIINTCELSGSSCEN